MSGFRVVVVASNSCTALSYSLRCLICVGSVGGRLSDQLSPQLILVVMVFLPHAALCARKSTRVFHVSIIIHHKTHHETKRYSEDLF